MTRMSSMVGRLSFLIESAKDTKGLLTWLPLALVLLLGCMQLIWVTAPGPGVHEDSYVYMETAKSLSRGDGFMYDGQPMTHFAPVYSVLLAATQLVFDHDNIADVARWLNVSLYGINLALIGVVGYVISGGSVLALVVSPLAVMLSGELLVVYSVAASESPFMAFAFGAFILLAMHIAAPRWSLLVGATLLLALAVATRYVGVTLLPPAVACLWFLGTRPLARRVWECLFVSFAGSLFLSAWLIRNFIVTAAPTDRAIAFHPVNLGALKLMVIRLCSLFFPIDIDARLQLGLLAFMAVLLGVMLYRRGSRLAAQALTLTIVVFCATYLAFIPISMSLFDALTEFEYRILAPAGVLSMVLMIALCLKVATRGDRTWARWLAGAFVLSVLISNLPEQWRIATDLHRNGYYFGARRWTESATVAFVRSIPETVTVYSNSPEAIGYLLERRARILPQRISALSLVPTPDFTRSTDEMCADVSRNGALIVFFKAWHWYFPTAEDLQSSCDVSVISQMDDGIVFGAK